MDAWIPSIGIDARAGLLLLAGIFLYWHLSRQHGYWKKRGIPYVPALPIIGSMLETFYKPMHETELRRYKKYGRLYGHYEGSRPVLSVAHPELVKDILIKDFNIFCNRRKMTSGDPIADNMMIILEGDRWKRVRSVMNPAFSTGRIKQVVTRFYSCLSKNVVFFIVCSCRRQKFLENGLVPSGIWDIILFKSCMDFARMFNVFEGCAKITFKNFIAAEQEGKPIDLQRHFGAFAMDVISRSAFSMKIDSLNDPSNRFVAAARAVFSGEVTWRLALLFLCPGLTRFLGIAVFAPATFRFFNKILLEIIHERQTNGQIMNDLLQLLMDTSQEVTENRETSKSAEEIDEENQAAGKINRRGISLTQNEVVAQCIILFLAGYDTTASTLSFLCYCLALDPRCQDRLVREIDTTIREAGGIITYEALQKMKYLDNVISETLRMYNSAIRIERLTGEAYILGNTGLTLPKDMIVSIPIFAMLWDPEYFPEPEKFNPDRFDEISGSVPYTFLPFGVGPRICLGKRFALVEMKVCLSYLLSHFKFRRCPETKVPVQYTMGLGLQAKAIKLKLERRFDGALIG